MREWATLAGSVVWLLGLCSLGPQISDLPVSLSGWQSGPLCGMEGPVNAARVQSSFRGQASSSRVSLLNSCLVKMEF